MYIFIICQFYIIVIKDLVARMLANILKTELAKFLNS